MIIPLLTMFFLTMVLKIALKLNVKSSVYLLLSLMISYSVFRFFSMTERMSETIVSFIMLILAMVVFGSNEIEDAWLIYIILCVIIGSGFHLFGF